MSAACVAPLLPPTPPRPSPHPAFAPSPLFTIRRARRARFPTSPSASTPPPPPPRPPRRTRVPRADTSAAPGWQWPGRTAAAPRREPAPPPGVSSWPTLGDMEASLLKVLRAVVSTTPLLLRVARVLRSVTTAFARVLAVPPPSSATSSSASSSSHDPSSTKSPFYAAVEFEYGLAEPDEADAFFVDPLPEWDRGADPFYRDSSGRPVFLHLTAATGVVLAADFRDAFDFDDHGDPADDPAADNPPSPPSSPSPPPSSSKSS